MPAKPSVTRIEIPGGWKETTVTLRGRQHSITLPADPDSYLEYLSTLEEPGAEPDPYWARLWPASLAMAEWVAGHAWPDGQRALELGCGIGLVGLAGLLAGLRLTFNDHVPLALELALENAERNGCTAEGLLFDWRTPPAIRYPLIFASDVLYSPQTHDVLLHLLDVMLDGAGVCWIGDPGRFHVESFVAQARQRQYRVELQKPTGEKLGAPVAGEFFLVRLEPEIAPSS